MLCVPSSERFPRVHLLSMCRQSRTAVRANTTTPHRYERVQPGGVGFFVEGGLGSRAGRPLSRAASPSPHLCAPHSYRRGVANKIVLLCLANTARLPPSVIDAAEDRRGTRFREHLLLSVYLQYMA